MSAWSNIAYNIQKNKNIIINWNEEFFICPKCKKKVAKIDWQEEDYFMGHKFTGKAYCPVCEEVIMEE